MSFSISGAFNMLAVDPPEEEAVVCAGRDEGKVTTMAHSSNGAMWQRFLKEARVAARSIASNKDPPYQVAWALNPTELNVPPSGVDYPTPPFGVMQKENTGMTRSDKVPSSGTLRVSLHPSLRRELYWPMIP
jgi:hypothetical protein